MRKTKKSTIEVHGTSVAILSGKEGDYISLTDMLQAKDGEFFISDWLLNRNTVEFLGIWESVFNPGFNYGEFAIIKSQVGLNSYKISVKEWVEKTNAIGFSNSPPTRTRVVVTLSDELSADISVESFRNVDIKSNSGSEATNFGSRSIS